MPTRLQRGSKHGAQPLWLRLFALFCIGVLGLASTAQVCHSHVDAFELSLLQASTAASGHAGPALHRTLDKQVSDDDSSSGVNCPLCVAMHSALPAGGIQSQVAMAVLATMTPRADGIGRVFSWRFEMVSRPPPAQRISA